MAETEMKINQKFDEINDFESVDLMSGGGDPQLFDSITLEKEGGSSSPTPSTAGFLFGARHTNGGTGATDYFKATYYQMRIYNTNISDADVTTNFNAIKTTYGL